MTFKEWRRRRKAARALKDAAQGLTLNSIGPLYGCERIKGESNRAYERRIRKAIMAVDKVWSFAGGKTEIKTEENSNGNNQD